jgi:hypothetical protein
VCDDLVAVWKENDLRRRYLARFEQEIQFRHAGWEYVMFDNGRRGSRLAALENWRGVFSFDFTWPAVRNATGLYLERY